ncbi:hypothetical protein [Streptomyces sp. SHP 1-2]|uniref:hypothetical protein n=1 Tax=Streptomyces sp. SHP 1-2 TaxID=2769489 RepID=UPI002237BF3C|nr:hypothetical protein [Streptomyces sp. SHP 1-2]MCW5253570.1 hypothetical protein [Streptomyces sp. SHP 1-2]
MRQHHRNTPGPARRRTASLIALPGAALLGLGLLVTATPAAADPAPRTAPSPVADAPSPAQLSAAHRAAGSGATLKVLETFFARDGVPPGRKGALAPAQEARAAAAAEPRLVGDAVPVYSLNPAFVTATAADRAPVAAMEFAASKAVDADGDTASVWTAKVDGRWQVVNIATGSDETDYAARADAGSGAVVFREPQLNAWYRVAAGRVLPLNDEARASVGARGTSLAGYQRLVHQRYADKMPGSGYDRAGYAGGFGPGAESGALAGAAAGGERAGTASGSGTAAVATGTGALTAAALAGVWLTRRRRLAGR